jgi:hypothetical protein
VAPLWLGGLRGKKSTPSIGWEVPVKSHRSTSGRSMERAGQRLRAGDLGYGTLPLFLHGRFLLYFTLLSLYFYWVKKMWTYHFNRELNFPVSLKLVV